MEIKRLRGLDGLRALCALVILFGHIAQRDFCSWELTPLPLPECCAYVFFVISGFLAGYREGHNTTILGYYRKKARRILPLYFSYLLLSGLVFCALGDKSDILDSGWWYYLILTPSIPFCTGEDILPWVHLWFIGSIVIFYALFPFFCRFCKVHRKGALVIALGWFVLKLVLRVLYGKESFGYRFVGVTSLDLCFLGVWGGYLESGNDLMVRKIRGFKWGGVIVWGLFLFTGLYGRYIPAPIRSEYVGVLSLLLIFSLQQHHSFSVIDNCFTNWIGKLSYEIYVVHIIVIILLAYGYERLGVNLPDALIYLICMILSVFCAWLWFLGLHGLRSRTKYQKSNNTLS